MPAGGGDARFGLIDTVVNIDHLRPYKRRPPQLGSSEEGDQPDALVIVPRGGTWWEVEDVMAHRHQRHGRRFFFLMSWPIGINAMVGDSFCGKWPRDSWGTRSQLHGQLKSCAAPRAAERMRTVPCLG